MTSDNVIRVVIVNERAKIEADVDLRGLRELERKLPGLKMLLDVDAPLPAPPADGEG
jgi:hypothetical protein